MLIPFLCDQIEINYVLKKHRPLHTYKRVTSKMYEKQLHEQSESWTK